MGSIADGVAAAYPLVAAAPTTVVRRHLDTFDWGVWRSGARLTLETEAGGTFARWERSGRARSPRVPVRGSVAFAHDLPDGPVQRDVAAAAGGRALLPVGEVRVRRRELRIVDAEGKTRVRVCLDTVQTLKDGAPAGPRRRLVTVEALVGYAAEGEAVAARVRALAGLDVDEEDELTRAAAARGREPGDYTSKVAVTIRTAEPAERAARRILTSLAATLAANVTGTVRDLDTEFLHDLRVATRRTRTCIGQLKDVFPTTVIERFAGEFKWLAAATNPCRDLDVFLAGLGERQRALASDQAAALAPLIDRLRAARVDTHRELVTVLESERFAALMRRWRRVLGRRLIGGERGTAPASAVAAERTVAAYRRLSSRARGLTPDASADDLHRLRIDAKKLRYLLEFFATLWDREETGALVAELKLVQDSLGEYHDAWLQGARLTALAPEVLASGAGAATLLAMGRLVADLERRRSAEAERVLDRLATFASPPFPGRFAGLVERRGGA